LFAKLAIKCVKQSKMFKTLLAKLAIRCVKQSKILRTRCILLLIGMIELCMVQKKELCMIQKKESTFPDTNKPTMLNLPEAIKCTIRCLQNNKEFITKLLQMSMKELFQSMIISISNLKTENLLL